MPCMNDSVVRFTHCISGLLIAIVLLNPAVVHAYQCGNGNDSCSLSQLASFLDRIKPGFETPDVVYDQIYSEGDSTIVFIQRLKRIMDRSQREFVKKHGANKESNIKALCSDTDLMPVLIQGLKLKYIVQDINRNAINTFVVEYADCVATN